jgi:sigma-E factor negative regulatory protein RseA
MGADETQEHEMTQEISSLMDGELEAPDAERAIGSCCKDSEAAQLWRQYHLIGEVMRGDAIHPTGTARRVFAQLAQEPAIIARPRRMIETTFGRIALAAAASVATIGVVGWIGTQGGQAPGSPVVARSPAAATLQPAANTAAPASMPVADVQDYLAAHRQIPSAELYRPVLNRTPASAAR